MYLHHGTEDYDYYGAITQTKKAIIRAENGQEVCISRHDCIVCQYMHNVHKITPDNPYNKQCENINGMKCPARDMCLEYCRTLRKQRSKKALAKRLKKHLTKLNTLLEESQ